jgi:hypothetical protein
MANPNSEIWGAPSSWVYTNISYGLETTVAKLANADKPKCKNFGSTSYEKFEQTLFSAVTHNVISLNTPLDRSLCPCGIAPDVSPWAKLAIFNESNNLSTTPSRIIEINNANTNWFFCNFRGSDNNAYTFNRYYSYSNDGGLRYQQFSPNAITSNLIYNQCLRVAPWLKYGIKSVLLTIQVRCIAHNAINPITGTFWTTLDNWKNNYPTYDICGLRFFVRACSAINSSTLALTYSNDDTGDKSGQIAVIQDIVVNNNGADVETEFLSLSIANQGNKDGYIFDVTPMIYNWSNGTDGRTNRAIFPCWNYFTGQTINFYKPLSSDPQGYYFYKIPYSADTYDKIMKIAACFGCYFTPTNKYQFAYDMLDNDLYLTVLDDNGVAHGQYTHGADNANNSLYSKNSIREIDYNPDAPPAPVDTNTYNNTTVFNVIGAGASMNKRYLLDAANVAKLSTDLFDICDSMSTDSDYSFFDSKVKANMLTQSPIDSIVSLIRYPFTPTHGGTKQPVKLGRFEASAEGYPISNAIQTITFAGVDIFPRFGNNFLDYEPYTKYEVYVPFCDTVELSAADILGHTLNVRLVVDLFTGVCTGYILADSLCIETTSGNVGVSLPLTGLDTATINANIANAEANKKAAKKNYIKGHFDIITQKDKVGALWTQILGTNEDVVKKADYDLKHIETPMHTIGAASPLTSWAMDLNARVIIYYPTGDAITDNTPPELRDLTTYGHTTGFATIINDTINSQYRSNKLSLVVATNPILNFAATKTEKEMIESALNGGIFI